MSLARTTVQELAATVEEPPREYVVDDMLDADEMPEPIPLIDLSRLMAVDEANKLRAALQTWGLFLATNHGIEESLMDAMMSASRDFFRQPSEEKQKYSNLIDGKHFQMEGYGNDKVVTRDQGLSWNDRLHLRVEPEDERNFSKWPTHPESFRSHTDGGLLTILFVDQDVGGLQVERGGKWYNVPAKPYTLVINVADCMEIMTNGIFRSPLHRVMTNANKERLSLARFYAVDAETMLEPAPSLLDDKRPPRYEKIKAKDFVSFSRMKIS
ncbi:probable 2-oxoglutarate-dependent dioxygenase ANS isoform X4 [Triticum dicoccoides]|uniref:probable 2-oxoglutarate-dependent dioxygenase ANS isoform X4 n=1 Tax=Triticum dicoccoides TaxID=85692 RepID=UPI001891DBFF|nr:probable 2-oxoglutarate-dependent dioxygenase ANS isoform X4 [Triticum dicoccoides]